MVVELLQGIKTEIERVISELGYNDPNLEIVLEIPKERKNGDYATNVAMRLAKIAKKPPLIIANEIINLIDQKTIHVSNIFVAGSGFINFVLDIDYLLEIVKTINIQGSDYGNINDGNNQKINIEFVSANPTGYLHIGHGRGAAYGDSLANIMKKASYNVDKEHYVNDAGNQITNMAYSVYERYRELYGYEPHMLEDYYYGKEIISIANKIKCEYGDRFITSFDLDFFKKYGTNELLTHLKEDLARFNVTFDVWFSELSLYKDNQVEKTIEYLKNNNYTYLQEGALWLKTTLFNDEKDRVIVKSDGSYTYLMPDICYHNNKLSRGYTQLIDVLGADHHGYINRIKAAVAMLGQNSDLLDIEILQMVRVLENGEEVKMSKRSGKAITLIDLIDEVGTDALRYFYVSKALNTQMDLDLDLMRKKSNENPVFYAQYAHARISSIFRNFANSNQNYEAVHNFTTIEKNKVKDICLTLIKYPAVIKEAASKRLVHKVTHYIDELAYELHSYYNDEKIITDNITETLEKLTILQAVQIVLKDALSLLGVSAPEQM